MTTETRPCTRCHGERINISPSFTSLEGRVYPETRRRCSCCDGRGYFEALDVQAIIAAIKGRNGLRSARPKDDRAYYVWRNARFHGGVDVTLPMMAGIMVHGDPFVPELNALVDAVAKQVYGTDLAAAHRWGTALGIIETDVPGLPVTAYHGQVVTADDSEAEF